jgi:hypothetical protein
MGIQYYLDLRDEYRPETLRAIFILESPPDSGKYFYEPHKLYKGVLFSAMMQYVLKSKPSSKEAGLIEFQQKGYILVDAIYEPVNNLLPSEKARKILGNYKFLCDDLKNVMRDQESRKPAIILVKTNICELLEQRLLTDGFNVINDGLIVPFPAYGHQKRFGEMMKVILAKIDTQSI